ncbi:MAG: histidinol dehydrogenase [Deltaproteobacteria bacterium]|jgi:histidinol dehydrogenase|nr:histidinol dehydrogenase [Deltaproteobacteria bacterium]
MICVEYLADLSPERRGKILARSTTDHSETRERTQAILSSLRADPEKELNSAYGHLRTNFKLSDLKVTEEERDRALQGLDKSLKAALEQARANITSFHKSQLERPMYLTEITQGLLAGRVTLPLARVGVYVPGGRASYPSSALMNILPAKVAGVERIVAATPPGDGLLARPEIVAACAMAGAGDIYKLGGAWAVGCLAYGLGGVPRVDKIVGPGSSWVTAAKMAVFGEVDVDQPAGPSEGFIIADKDARPEFLAWDFLAQLEHDPQAAAVLVSLSEKVAREVAGIINKLLPTLGRGDIVRQSLGNAAILVAPDKKEAFDFANEYAPEHIQLVLVDPLASMSLVRNAGSIFLGPYSPICAGDYATGPNHVLPTGQAARAFSGLSVDSFQKKMTFQKLTRGALHKLAETVTTLALAEGLPNHAESLRVRFLRKKSGAPENGNNDGPPENGGEE